MGAIFVAILFLGGQHFSLLVKARLYASLDIFISAVWHVLGSPKTEVFWVDDILLL